MPQISLSQSYARGSQATPLMEQTMGEYFRDKAASQPERDALISRHLGQRYIRFVSGFPMTVTGKIQEFKIRELMVDELQLHAEPTA